MPLNDTAIRNAKPGEKPVKMFDERGLFLIVTPAGGKWWRLRYKFAGKEKLLSLGTYPDVGLKDARAKRDEARKLLAQEIDPGEHRKTTKAAKAERSANSFEVICREWLDARKANVGLPQHTRALARMENDVFPWLGAKPIVEITAPDVLKVLRRIDERGARYSAHRVRSEISRAFRYAIATGRAERDPCPDLQGAIPPAKETHFAALVTPKEAGELLRAIDGFKGTFVVLSALRLAPLLFVRPGELRKAEWASIDFDRADWRYLVTKTNTEHLVPLATQALEILKDLHALTGHGRYVFPGRDPQKPMSEAAINAALRRMGYDTKTEITGHGFRAMARTILHEELHQKPEVIEHQLAHAVPDVLGAAYNRTKFLKERKVMMQLWADYLGKLKAGAEVIPLHGSAA
ncbi:tyrosine-type recombinase/integrase [Ferribacterium limneticum]|uniref:tyrosine-type recombinase/integrase n=1 Tax=Ferribacterium limneticum TaxID=76259 RepID=UPI001CF9EDE8|nr:integrase arm-type DNA-binding domain-containing protein [Ferribacterium limneticum]UCV28606.1 integrase arm-type DNA-binding domain-containing protein [Ferribacterium limneticum]UCV32523.1 integrase arm-type DNA-binding domain-containing protein [Ferribacterium limneticum]